MIDNSAFVKMEFIELQSVQYLCDRLSFFVDQRGP
jgi:hypothetical protein